MNAQRVLVVVVDDSLRSKPSRWGGGFLSEAVQTRAPRQGRAGGPSKDAKSRASQADLLILKRRFSLLIPRESEVLGWLIARFLNKHAAAELGVSEVALQVHRGHVMQKMEAGSSAELVRMALKLGISLPATQRAFS